ncbi:beta-ketoacyl-[acyl-carrier-protein] synthase family protein [Streptomyces sp. NPDC058877]|uniref:beta-ketoacyl-[acyl-carrier-protein] synthase family protein n=1 Tax=unclassified Streptomyces TaxID=2593676 RepID=UPI0036A98499
MSTLADAVAVTGVGLVTPAGIGREVSWERVCGGRSTARADPDLAGLAVDISCRVPGWEPPLHVPDPRPWQFDRYAQFALAAAAEAVADAGLDPAAWDGDRVAVVLGTGTGGLGTQLQQHAKLLLEGPRYLSPMLLQMCLPNMAAGQVAIQLRARGPVLATATACASGATAIGTAWDLLRAGACDVAVAGAADASVHPLLVSAFDRMGALSKHTEHPAEASRPFDRARDGFVIAEGAGVLVLEPARKASARGRPGYALLSGYGASCDAHHPVAPHPDGEGAALAVHRALEQAGALTSEVDHINAHGTGTALNDAAEARMVNRLFPHRPAVTAPKGVLGHLLGAAGAVEAALTALTVSRGTIPPIGNLRDPDPEYDLDTVRGESRSTPVSLALSHSFGFGGHNTALAFRPTQSTA